MGGKVFEFIIFIKTIASGGRGGSTSVFNSENVWQDAGERRRDQKNNVDLSFTYVDYIIKCSVCIRKEINPHTRHVQRNSLVTG